jgi:tRNA threonylcarbamoyl adenosine modification protein YjeE
MLRDIPDVEALKGFARELASLLSPGRVLTLAGPMGAGKTTLVRELVEVLGLDAREVRSPTFSLVNVYSGPRGRAYHVDLYRAESEADLAGIDIEDYLYDPEAFAFVEWPERIANRLPPGALAVRLEFAPDLGEQGRRAELEERR